MNRFKISRRAVYGLLVCILLAAAACRTDNAFVKNMIIHVGDSKFTEDTLVQEVVDDPVFGSYGRLIFPVDKDIPEGTRLKDASALLPGYNYVDPARTVDVVNYMKNEVTHGGTIFFPIYTRYEMEQEPEKENAGLFFFRGEEGRETAIVSAGGGFSYVGAIHDSFPQALELSRRGINAFALIYRPDEKKGTEDLARAIHYLCTHADELDISMDGYSLWGSSSGAKLTAAVGNSGTGMYGEEDHPRPSALVLEYTNIQDISDREPPTYAVVGSADDVTPPAIMQNRIDRIREQGTPAEIEVFPGLLHGFGAGDRTVAAGWIDRSVLFWEGQR
ncbi:hypothetical protein TAMA11512_20780 [Selenomonas sp. TAMA-11512]|uniref:alpha/beta hydrolase n=1 Tax=Selenomonas sp. TAMA-11512 TaxID=3095337 RepID=UPI0030850F42|nr:hypothetical protein TAMA11512_20780 [Selenomonas sp. TAMA-11512]